MNRNQGGLRPLYLTALALLGLTTGAEAQIFSYHNSDLCLSFRKVSPYTENNEVVVNIGQASNYLNAAVGTQLPVSQVSAAQLGGSFTSLNNLTWGVYGWYTWHAALDYPNYPHGVTLWLTVPRTNNAVRSPDAVRVETGQQAQAAAVMGTIFSNARYVSQQVAISNAYNTPTWITESIANYPDRVVTPQIGSSVDSTVGNLQDNWANNLENTTPAAFSGTLRSDLYEVRPLIDYSGATVTDPHTGTSGLAYYVGYFELSSTGTLTFTRDVASAPLPAPVRLTIARTNNVNTIAFTSASSVTYQLRFTNAAGLSTPFSNWPAASGTISGDGTLRAFQDTTTDLNRFYRVQEH